MQRYPVIQSAFAEYKVDYSPSPNQIMEAFSTPISSTSTSEQASEMQATRSSYQVLEDQAMPPPPMTPLPQLQQDWCKMGGTNEVSTVGAFVGYTGGVYNNGYGIQWENKVGFHMNEPIGMSSLGPMEPKRDFQLECAPGPVAKMEEESPLFKGTHIMKQTKRSTYVVAKLGSLIVRKRNESQVAESVLKCGACDATFGNWNRFQNHFQSEHFAGAGVNTSAATEGRIAAGPSETETEQEMENIVYQTEPLNLSHKVYNSQIF